MRVLCVTCTKKKTTLRRCSCTNYIPLFTLIYTYSYISTAIRIASAWYGKHCPNPSVCACVQGGRECLPLSFLSFGVSCSRRSTCVSLNKNQHYNFSTRTHKPQIRVPHINIWNRIIAIDVIFEKTDTQIQTVLLLWLLLLPVAHHGSVHPCTLSTSPPTRSSLRIFCLKHKHLTLHPP